MKPSPRPRAADGCIFCAIVAGRAPATIVTETRDSVLFRPLSPVVDGHVLVVPTEHVADAATNPTVTAMTMYDAARYARDHHDQFNIITSAGDAATQSIFHLHLHVVPRTVDDGLMVPWGTLHGEDPKAPHRCRRVVALEAELARRPRAGSEHVLTAGQALTAGQVRALDALRQRYVDRSPP